MSDPMPDIDFEDVPPIAQRSPHLPLLLALKGAPGRSARIHKDAALSQTDAAKLANTLKNAAAKIGDGYDVATRYLPAFDYYGVWVTYSPAEGDEPPIPTPEQRAEAKAMIDEAMTPAYRRDAIPAESAEVVGDGSGEALPPIEDEWEFPEPETIPVGPERASG
jgi:hypothetical protein